MEPNPMRYSYFLLTFGQEEACLKPEQTCERLKRYGYDAIEICPPPKGRDGIDYLKFMERIADYQNSPEFPNGFSVDPQSKSLKYR